MSEPSNGAWPFQEIPEEEGLDISAIFGNSSAVPQGDPFAPPAAAQSIPPSPAPVMPEITPAVTATSQPATAPIVNVPAKAPAEASAENPIAAAFEQKTAENTKKGLLKRDTVPRSFSSCLRPCADSSLPTCFSITRRERLGIVSKRRYASISTACSLQPPPIVPAMRSA